MMATRYLVLRARSALEGLVDFSPGSDLELDSFSGDDRDADSAREDPRNAAVMDADAILTLIEPREGATASPTALVQSNGQMLTDGIIAVGAHNSPCTGRGVTVAVLDTGIDDRHPAFQGKQIVKQDFTGTGVLDTHGHGTHCAGTICGSPVDGTRIGVAPGIEKLCVGKVLAPTGGSLEMLLKGMLWAVMEQKAAVVSMSLGYDLAGNNKRMIQTQRVDPALATSAVLRQQADILKGISALRFFLETQAPNVIFAAATGNESKRPTLSLDASLPASELFAVGAVGHVGDKWAVAEFSNNRAQVVAPGVDVVSAAIGGSGWSTKSGTSMATPHVAGVAALWVERLRNGGQLSVPGALIGALKSNATRQPLSTNDVGAIGAGMIQAPQ
jgi:subtilisin family serine protease